MKLSIIIIPIFCLMLMNLVTANQNSLSFQNHLAMMLKMKTKTRTMLENLYISANRIENEKNHNDGENNFLEKKFELNSKTSKNTSKTKFFTKFHYQTKAKRTTSHVSNFGKELLQSSKQAEEVYIQYRYLSYDDVVDELIRLAKEYPDYLRVTTAQEEYKLPNPGGICGDSQSKRYLYIC
jgi:hypothetical protein